MPPQGGFLKHPEINLHFIESITLTINILFLIEIMCFGGSLSPSNDTRDGVLKLSEVELPKFTQRVVGDPMTLLARSTLALCVVVLGHRQYVIIIFMVKQYFHID